MTRGIQFKSVRGLRAEAPGGEKSPSNRDRSLLVYSHYSIFTIAITKGKIALGCQPKKIYNFDEKKNDRLHFIEVFEADDYFFSYSYIKMKLLLKSTEIYITVIYVYIHINITFYAPLVA